MKLVIVLALLAVAGYGVYLYLRSKKHKENVEEAETPSEETSGTGVVNPNLPEKKGKNKK